MSQARSKNALIAGLRTNHQVGLAIGELAVNTRNALHGVAGELEKHDLKLGEVEQLLDVMRQLLGVYKIEAVQILAQPTTMQVSAGGAVRAITTSPTREDGFA